MKSWGRRRKGYNAYARVWTCWSSWHVWWDLKSSYRIPINEETIIALTSCWVLKMSIQVSGVVEHWNTMMGLSPTIGDSMLTWPNNTVGGNTDNPVAASSRGFISKNKKKTKSYLDHLDKYFLDHKICKRIDKLIKDAPRVTRTTLKRWYEGLDTDITRGMPLKARFTPTRCTSMIGLRSLIRLGTVSATGKCDTQMRRTTVSATRHSAPFPS
jgi:hypothetical protein